MASIDYYAVERSFLAFCASQGIAIPGSIQMDGAIHRFKLESDKHGERSGTYCVWPEGKGYDGKPHGWIQDHHECGEKHYWQFYNKDNPSPKREATAEERAEAVARREAETR